MREYARYGVQNTSVCVRSWIGDEAIEEALLEEIEAARAFDAPERLEQYARSCPVPGALPTDYGLREVGLPGGRSALVRIHFFALDRMRPFIDVTARTGRIGPGDLEAWAGWLAEEYRLFRPRTIRLWTATPEPYLQVPGVRVDQHLVAGELPRLLDRPRPAGVDRVTLARDRDGSCSEEYAAAYEAFFREHPGARAWLPVESGESLRTYAKEGAVYRVFVDGEPAGVTAAAPGCEKALRGWVMVDEILVPRFRGTGLGPAMQRALLERLDPKSGRFLLGTIDGRNAASLRTALRVGRESVGAWIFVPVG